jgi:hypothetical protein
MDFLLWKAKEQLLAEIDHYLYEKITMADKEISENYAQTKINDGDVILTYAWSVLSMNTCIPISFHSNFCPISLLLIFLSVVSLFTY